ncbi:MAG: hypothetical protein R3E10_03900 [Gemmatimonadota bacterium]
MRVPFAIGRLTPRSTEIVLLNRRRQQTPVPGPWQLRALVRPVSGLRVAQA